MRVIAAGAELWKIGVPGALAREARALARLGPPWTPALLGWRTVGGHPALALERLDGESWSSVARAAGAGRGGGWADGGGRALPASVPVSAAVSVSAAAAVSVSAAAAVSVPAAASVPVSAAVSAAVSVSAAASVPVSVPAAVPAAVSVSAAVVDETRDYLALALIDAVAALHVRGVIHGDLSGANVMRLRDGSLRLLDLGESVCEGDEPGGPPSVTAAYAAPELLDGACATRRSDVYALGVLLFELYAGRPPFTGSAAAIQQAHRRQRAPRLGARSTVSAAIDALVAACLAKDPSERPADAAEVASRWRTIAEVAPPMRVADGSGPIAIPEAHRVAADSVIKRQRIDVRTVGAVDVRFVHADASRRESGTSPGLENRTHVPEASGVCAAVPVEVAPVRDLPLIGRAAEIAVLRDGLVRVAAGATIGVLVIGEAGAGTSRLMAELATENGRMYVVDGGGERAIDEVVAAAGAAMGVREPQAAWRWLATVTTAVDLAALRVAAGHATKDATMQSVVAAGRIEGGAGSTGGGADVAPAMGRKSVKNLETCGEQEKAAEYQQCGLRDGVTDVEALLRPLRAAPGALRHAAVRALTAALVAAGRQAGLAIAIDHAGRAEPIVVDAVERALASEGARGLWLALVGGADVAQRRAKSPLPPPAAWQVVDVGALEGAAGRELAAAALPGCLAVPQVVLDRIVELAGGVPRWIVELCGALERGGAVRRGADGALRWLTAVAEGSAVERADRMVARDLGRMAASLRAHAWAHALISEDGEIARTVDVVERIAAADASLLPLDHRAAVRSLIACGLLRDGGARAPFRHASVRDAVVRAVPAEFARQVHHAALDEARARGGALERIARHAEGAGESALAAQMWLEAAVACAARHDYLRGEHAADRAHDAANYDADRPCGATRIDDERACSVTEGDNERATERDIERGCGARKRDERGFAARKGDERGCAARKGDERGRDPELTAVRFEALRWRATMRARLGRHDEACADFVAVREAARARGDVCAEIDALLDEATARDWARDDAAAARLTREALRIEATDVGVLRAARLAMAVGRAAWRGGDEAAAIVQLERVLSMLGEEGSVSGASEAGEVGGMTRAAVVASGARADDESYETRIAAKLMLGYLLPDHGQIERAARLLDEARVEARARGDRLHEAAASNNMLAVARAKGRPEEAIEGLGEVIAIGRELGMLAVEYRGRVNRALMLVRVGRDGEAAEDLGPAAMLDRALPALFPVPRATLGMARLAVRGGEIEKGRRLVEEADGMLAAGGGAWSGFDAEVRAEIGRAV